MLGLGKEQKKLSLYMLEEGEQYIKDFIGTASFYCTVTQQMKEEKVVVHFCTRSIVVEVDNVE